MKYTRLAPILFLFIFSSSILAQAQDYFKYKTFGPDMEILSYGGSLGGFYSIYPRSDINISFESDWTLVESRDSYSYYDQYYQRPVSINSQNLSFVKLLAGLTWYPFLESMHPSVQVGGFASLGPLLSLNTKDDEGFFERWQDVETDVVGMGRAGVVIKVLSGEGSSYIFRFGYDYAKFDHVIDSRQTYKGVFFQAGMEFLHR